VQIESFSSEQNSIAKDFIMKIVDDAAKADKKRSEKEEEKKIELIC
jgi:hypothetical protein